MDNKDKLYLSRIISGYLRFKYKEQSLYLVYPSLSIKYEAELLAEDLYNEYKFSDWINSDDIMDILSDHGLWSQNHEKNLYIIEKQIEKTKIELYKSFFSSNKQKPIRLKLNNLKKTYEKHYSLRHSLDHLTVNGFCEKYKNDFLLLNSVFKKDNNQNVLFFDSQNYDPKILEDIAYEISRHNIDIPTFRKLARSDGWRTYWSANKANIFDQAAIEWTDEQRTLVAFTKMYDAAYESSETPPDPVFDDDDMFDGWMLLQNETIKEERQKNSDKKSGGNKMSKAQELFIMASDKNDASQIYNMNTAVGKTIIAERNSAINRNKTIEASQLPDTKKELNLAAQESFKNKVRNK